MDYQGNIFRPPSEADSILLQVTTGCSHNKCTFCEMYTGVRFSIKSDDVILRDIEYASRHLTYCRRLFICDGDALIIPQKRLIRILSEIKDKLPWVERIGIYANSKSLKRKTKEELEVLKGMGLGIVYLGLESGDNETLARIHKGADAGMIVSQGRKCIASGIKLSVTVLLGIAGTERSLIHARETGKILSEMDPHFVGALSLMLTPGTPLYKDHEKGLFQLPDSLGMLKELREMIAYTDLSGGLFHANHASNYLPIRARLPQDKKTTIRMIDDALSGNISLKPEYMRAL